MISGVHVGRVFLVALIFAVVFAALGFGISLLYEKFLAADSSAQGFSDLSASQSDVSQQKKGQAVDIVIQDEELPADENAGQYYVGTNRFMLNSEDLGAQKKSPAPSPQLKSTSAQSADNVAETIRNENRAAVAPVGTSNIKVDSTLGAASNENQFVPVRNLETLYNASGKEAVTKKELSTSSAQQAQKTQGAPVAASISNGGEQSFSADDEQLDTLPDLEGMGMFENDDSSSGYAGEADMNNESDFATGEVRVKKEQPEVKDAELMAKAISTILTNE